MKFKRAIPHDISIKATPNGGFIVTVGCVQVAYSNYGSLLQDLTEYFSDPEAVEKQYAHDITSSVHSHPPPMLWANRATNMQMTDLRQASESEVEPTEGPLS